MTDSRFVEERLASLEPSAQWRPDSSAALLRMHSRDRAWRRSRRWMWIATAASVLSLSVLAVPGRCDTPGANSCGQPLANRIWTAVFPKPVLKARLAPPVEAEPVAPTQPPVAIAQNRPPAARRRPAPVLAAPVQAPNFKEFGVPSAPIVCEIYSDYQCPACAVLYKQIVPPLIAQYVQSGKVKILHRDFPLPQHTHAREAARYANAAGRLGQYDIVVNQLFQTQNIWEADGNIDAQVAQVLAPGIMQKVRELVRGDATLDDTVNTDMAMGLQDAIHQTPTIVVVSKGKRQILGGGVPDFQLLKTYLDELLK